MHGLLKSTCHVSLKNHLEAEPEYQQIVARNLFNAIMLRNIIKNICNSSACVTVDDVNGNSV